MDNELLQFLKSNGIPVDPDYYRVIRVYIFGGEERGTKLEEHRFTKNCVFFTSDNFFDKNSYAMAHTVVALGLTRCYTEEFLKKLITARRMIEIMWPGWFEFLREKEEKGEKVHAGDS